MLLYVNLILIEKRGVLIMHREKLKFYGKVISHQDLIVNYTCSLYMTWPYTRVDMIHVKPDYVSLSFICNVSRSFFSSLFKMNRI